MIRIFVGSAKPWLCHEPVLEHSIRKHASRPVEITFVHPLGFGMHETGCTSFTNVRYAIPELAGRAGYAIYLDVDMLVLGNIAELWDMRQRGRWVRLADGADEVSVIDCSIQWLPEAKRLHLFQKWHLRQMVEDCCVDRIPLHWNCEDPPEITPDMRLVHFTNLDQQPWIRPERDDPAARLLRRYEAEAA